MLENQENSSTGTVKEISHQNKVLMYYVNGCLLLAHCLFIFFFSWLQVDLMFYYNFISILTYIVCFFVIKQSRSSQFAFIIYTEIFIFMILGTMCLGWSYGFQQYCFGFVVSTMFSDFFLGVRERMRKRIYVVVLLVIIVYVGLRLWTWYEPFLYSVSHPSLGRVFFIVNAILVMGFITAFIVLYASNAYRMQRELKKRATSDMLTGLVNRRQMQTMLIHRVNETTDNDLMGVAILDIDFFKKVNDRYGHDAGDIVLQGFSDIIRNRTSDAVEMQPSRWGGEEFLLLFTPKRAMDRAAFEHQIDDYCEGIRAVVEKTPIAYRDTTIPITVTAGVTVLEEGMNATTLFKRADELLYYGKEHGRNCVISSI